MIAWLAAILIIAAAALFVAAPLAGGISILPRLRRRDREVDRLLHEQGLAIQGLRELEFDQAMGKLSADDYQSLRARLESHALAAMTELENHEVTGDQSAPGERSLRLVEPVHSTRAVALVPAGSKLRFCPQCGARLVLNANFCGECGAALSPGIRTERTG